MTQTKMQTERPCVVVHAWYSDVFDEILLALQNSGLTFRLIVTTCPEKSAQIQAILEGRAMQAEIEVMENRGRDILPFLQVANRLLDEGEDIVLKVHSKCSPKRTDGDDWRNELLDGLLSPRRADKIFQAFVRDNTLGMVAPDGHIQALHHYWGANEESVKYLVRRLGIAMPEEGSSQFVPGSMFWARLGALRPLLDAHLDYWEFDAEDGQLDGTFAHAIERVFTLCAQYQGLEIRKASLVCGEPEPQTTEAYPYARRG